MSETTHQAGLQSSTSASTVRLFCFPHAGGNSSAFSGWAQHLPVSVDLKAVELPGRQRRFREPPFQRLAPLVQALIGELRPWMTSPPALFGHSMGALIAFEFAREMRRNGLPAPAHLFVSSYPAPQLPRRDTHVHTLPPQIFRQKVAGLLPREVLANEELLSVVLPVLRADFALVETYKYTEEPPLDCPITALGGAWDLGMRDADLKLWAQQTTREFEMKLFPGKHYYLQTDPEQLLRMIGNTLLQ